MRCPSCGTENAPESQYCTGCGVPLEPRAAYGQPVVYCTSCGTENASAAAFCTSCGTTLSGPQGAGTPGDTGPYARVPSGATGNLVPRDLGELLSETSRVYGRNFWAFLAIAVIPEIVSLIGQLLPVLSLFVLFTVVAIVLSILVAGATVAAVARQYLGRQVSVAGCYATARLRFGALFVGLILFLVPPILWGFLVVIFGLLAAPLLTLAIIVGLPLVLYFVVRWFFYSEAIMIETRGPVGALRRSGELVRGSWWRVFGIGIVFVIVVIILWILLSIPGFIGLIFSPIAGAILLTISASVVAPIAYIGGTLLDFDLRVRKEGYSLEEMASEVGG